MLSLVLMWQKLQYCPDRIVKRWCNASYQNPWRLNCNSDQISHKSREEWNSYNLRQYRIPNPGSPHCTVSNGQNTVINSWLLHWRMEVNLGWSSQRSGNQKACYERGTDTTPKTATRFECEFHAVEKWPNNLDVIPFKLAIVSDGSHDARLKLLLERFANESIQQNVKVFQRVNQIRRKIKDSEIQTITVANNGLYSESTS
jgi:hypothetical protein